MSQSVPMGLLNVSRDGDSITTPGSPFQCLTSTSVKKCFLNSNLNLPWYSLKLLPFVLPLSKKMNTSLLQFMYSGRAEKLAALQLLKTSGFCSPFQPVVIIVNQLVPKRKRTLHYWFLPYFQYFVINTHTTNISVLPSFPSNTSDKIKFEDKQKQS